LAAAKNCNVIVARQRAVDKKHVASNSLPRPSTIGIL